MRTEFDYTMMSTFQTCERKYYFRMVKNLVGKEAQQAPEYGKCFHKALDVWHSERDVEKAIACFKAVYKDNPEDDKRTCAVAEKSLKLYAEKYQEEPLKIVHTELEFKVLLPNGNHLVGRIDKIVDWEGVLYVLDHKTTSQLGAGYFNAAEPSLQFQGYVWAARQLGHPVRGVIVDAVLVAKGILNSTSLAKLTPCARYEASYTDAQIEEWLHTVMQIQSDIVDCTMSEVYVPNWGSCVDYGVCPYRRICKEDPELRDRVIKADYKEEVWSPLTKEAG